jgi:hypothetical protein
LVHNVEIGYLIIKILSFETSPSTLYEIVYANGQTLVDISLTHAHKSTSLTCTYMLNDPQMLETCQIDFWHSKCKLILSPLLVGLYGIPNEREDS